MIMQCALMAAVLYIPGWHRCGRGEDEALQSVRAALAAMQSGLTPDAVLTETEEAMAALGELTGKTIREDITDRIFSRFCVGK